MRSIQLNNLICRNTCQYFVSVTKIGLKAYSNPIGQLAGFSDVTVGCQSNKVSSTNALIGMASVLIDINANIVRSNQYGNMGIGIIIMLAINVIPANIAINNDEIDVSLVVAGEDIEIGRFVHVANSLVHKASRSAGYEAHGFILNAVEAGKMATVHFEGNNNKAAFFGTGTVFLGDDGFASAVQGNGNISQKIGVATSDNNINFEAGLKTIRNY